jgi:exodeoxyribonuclease VII large subunit
MTTWSDTNLHTPVPASRAETGEEREIYSVSRLNAEARALLEGGFPLIWIEGEVSNLARPASGHLYFTLKDADAQVRCAMFRSRNTALAFRPEDGLHVLARARVSLYENRGDFQLIIDHLDPAGDGALRLAYEQLKQRLAAEGLFDAMRKRPLPRFPRAIGLVTSASGAAIRDIVSVLRRRFPALPVFVYPTAVQGPAAPAGVIAALDLAGGRRECDVVIVARGGGSLEDLQAFNNERVARAILASPIPVVTGIGHEIDFTIADFVADLRAATPSAAAELVSPDAAEVGALAGKLLERLRMRIRSMLERRAQDLDWLERRLIHPQRMLETIADRLQRMALRLALEIRTAMGERRNALMDLRARLERNSPLARLVELNEPVTTLRIRLETAATSLVRERQSRLRELARALHSTSPLATLGRGYAIVTREVSGHIVRSSSEAAVGDRVGVRLGSGSLRARVESVAPEPAGTASIAAVERR